MTDYPDHAPGPLAGTYWVEIDRLMAGPYPGSWLKMATLKRLDKLLGVGITYFLDLTETRELAPYEQLLPNHVRHERLSIRDMEIPTDAHMIAILDTLDAALAAGHAVYLHCWGGIGRTGTVIGCWLVRRGMGGQAALDRIVSLRAGLTNSPQTDEQFDMVRRWEPGK